VGKHTYAVVPSLTWEVSGDCLPLAGGVLFPQSSESPSEEWMVNCGGGMGVAGRGGVLATAFLDNLHYDTRVASWRTNAVDVNGV